MIASYARNRYQEMQVQTTSGKLVVMLYDGALRFLALALEAMRTRDLEQQGYCLGRAQEILLHLSATLDHRAGNIARDLELIYRACIRKLLAANLNDDPSAVEQVRQQLAELRDAWAVAERRAAQ